MLDILQYCKLLDFVKQNEFSVKLFKTDWGAQEQMLDGGRVRTLATSMFPSDFLMSTGRQMPYPSSFAKISEEGIETHRFGGGSP